MYSCATWKIWHSSGSVSFDAMVMKVVAEFVGMYDVPKVAWLGIVQRLSSAEEGYPIPSFQRWSHLYRDFH